MTSCIMTSHAQPLRSRVGKEREIFKQRAMTQLGNKNGAGSCFRSNTVRPCLAVYSEEENKKIFQNSKGGLRCAARAGTRTSRSNGHLHSYTQSYAGSCKGTMSRSSRPCLTPTPADLIPLPTPCGIAQSIIRSSRLSAPGLRSTTPRGCISWRESDPAPLQHTGIDLGFITMPPPVD
eukprot:TRINITY_DN4853_c5_g1_i1.p1 TRINITY_DN4853_c5_g1~~TRINITY_DN4853_c5_g1_i1.p1  ORF type:complete len:190 (+),score=22.58 TRINITY_DN4853_c5_g1_i1:37-570(+)